MKPTSDKFEPRKDGWFQHEGTWGEVVVGTVIQNNLDPRKRWEIIATAHGPGHVVYGETLWMRAREQTSGEEISIPPRPKVSKVVILTQDPADEHTGDPTPPSDAESVMLLARELGAEVMATYDEHTGEVTCPDYSAGKNHLERGPFQLQRGLAEHLRFAHGMSVDETLEIAPLITLHGQAHNPEWPNIGKGGFSHRHVPEDLSKF